MNRSEHLQWCKDRALEYVDAGDNSQAFASMASDLGKHPETDGAQNLCATMGIAMLVGGQLNSQHQMRKFIEGFN